MRYTVHKTNIFTFPAEKYCCLVIAEGGIEILKDLLADEVPYPRIKELAQMVLVHCAQFQERGAELEPQLDG